MIISLWKNQRREDVYIQILKTTYYIFFIIYIIQASKFAKKIMLKMSFKRP